MGLGEMMGVKNVKLELKGNYATLADLLEAMKDIQFEAGWHRCGNCIPAG